MRNFRGFCESGDWLANQMRASRIAADLALDALSARSGISARATSGLSAEWAYRPRSAWSSCSLRRSGWAVRARRSFARGPPEVTSPLRLGTGSLAQVDGEQEISGILDSRIRRAWRTRVVGLGAGANWHEDMCARSADYPNSDRARLPVRHSGYV